MRKTALLLRAFLLVFLTTSMLTGSSSASKKQPVGKRRRAATKKDPSIPVAAVEALQQGRLTRAQRLIDGHLQRQPRGRSGHAVLGGIESRLGWAPEALEAFDAGVGSLWYAGAGRPLHANALRAVGRGHEAVALRREDTADDRPGVQLRTYAAMVDDLRYADDPIGAEQVLAEGLGRWPRSSLLLTVGADLALDRHDIADAESWLALVQHFGGPVRRTRHTRLRIALMEGDTTLADDICRALLRVQSGDALAIAAQAQSVLDRGQPEEAMAILASLEASSRGDAPLLMVEVQTLRALGQQQAAETLLSFVQARHPFLRDQAPPEAHASSKK